MAYNTKFKAKWPDPVEIEYHQGVWSFEGIETEDLQKLCKHILQLRRGNASAFIRAQGYLPQEVFESLKGRTVYNIANPDETLGGPEEF